MRFAVIPLHDPDPDQDRKLFKAVTDIDSNAYIRYLPRVCFVRFKGSAATLATRLGFSSDASIIDPDAPKDGIVLSADQHFGYGFEDMWQWFEDD